MRKVVLYTLMSLDGAVDDPDQYFLPPDGSGTPEFDSEMSANAGQIITAQDAVIMGRRTYEEWSRFWSTVEHQRFADFINNVKKYIVTSTPLSNDWRNCEPVQWPVADRVRELKDQPGGNIGIHGSVQLAQSMLAAGLVDELQLVVGPAIGLPGRRLFTTDAEKRGLELLSASASSSGSLLLSYRVH
jgi:dihydrofolate reductase